MLEDLIKRTYSAIRLYKISNHYDISEERKNSIHRIQEICELNKQQNSAPDVFMTELMEYVNGMNGWLRKKMAFLDGSDLRKFIKLNVFDFYEKDMQTQKKSNEIVAMFSVLNEKFEEQTKVYNQQRQENKTLRDQYQSLDKKVEEIKDDHEKKMIEMKNSYEAQIQELKKLVNKYLKTIETLGLKVQKYKDLNEKLQEKVREQASELRSLITSIQKLAKICEESGVSKDIIAKSLPSDFIFSEELVACEFDNDPLPSIPVLRLKNNMIAGQTFFNTRLAGDDENKGMPVPLQISNSFGSSRSLSKRNESYVTEKPYSINHDTPNMTQIQKSHLFISASFIDEYNDYRSGEDSLGSYEHSRHRSGSYSDNNDEEIFQFSPTNTLV